VAYTELSDYPYNLQMIEYSRLNKTTLNPSDYLDFGSRITVKTSPLEKEAEVKTRLETFTVGVERISARHVDRTTGEVSKPTLIEFGQLACVPVSNGDIIIHKYGCRIGRVGIIEFEGQAEHHFIKVIPRTIKPYYLLFALRSIPVIRQLPFRETARPGIRKGDVEKLRIPRLENDIEEKMSEFLAEVFFLRRRASKVISLLLENFDHCMEQATSQEDTFLVENSRLSPKTLDPGSYYLWIFERLLRDSFRLQEFFDIIQPPTLLRGEAFLVITAKNFRMEGIIPQLPRDVSSISEKNYAYPNDVLLNRISSEKLVPWKATVVLSDLEYLSYYGINVDVVDNIQRIPVSEDVFILRSKKDKVLSYYLALVLNSSFFQKLLEHSMGGSTGMQVLRKTKLDRLLVPKLEDRIMKAFSDSYRMCLTTKNATLASLTTLNRLYEDTIIGQESSEKLAEFLTSESSRLGSLSANMGEAEKTSIETVNFTYTFE